MTPYQPTPVRDLVPGSRFLAGHEIVSVTQVIRGTATVAIWTRGRTLLLPADAVVDATLPDGEVWCRRCEVVRGIDGECRCGASAIGAMPWA